MGILHDAAEHLPAVLDAAHAEGLSLTAARERLLQIEVDANQAAYDHHDDNLVVDRAVIGWAACVPNGSGWSIDSQWTAAGVRRRRVPCPIPSTRG